MGEVFLLEIHPILFYQHSFAVGSSCHDARSCRTHQTGFPMALWMFRFCGLMWTLSF